MKILSKQHRFNRSNYEITNSNNFSSRLAKPYRRCRLAEHVQALGGAGQARLDLVADGRGLEHLLIEGAVFVLLRAALLFPPDARARAEDPLGHLGHALGRVIQRKA